MGYTNMQTQWPSNVIRQIRSPISMFTWWTGVNPVNR